MVRVCTNHADGTAERSERQQRDEARSERLAEPEMQKADSDRILSSSARRQARGGGDEETRRRGQEERAEQEHHTRAERGRTSERRRRHTRATNERRITQDDEVPTRIGFE